MRRKTSYRRGRLPGKRSRADLELFENISRISLNHEIDSNKLFEKIVNAWKQQESTCEDLKILCRKRTIDNQHTFLFTNDNKVIAQFPIPEHILKKTNPLKDFTPTKSFRNTLFKKKTKLTHPQIGDLRTGMKRINVKARILEIPEARLVFTKWGSSAIVTNVLIGDETGTIKLPLWNEMIKAVSIGDIMQIENAYVTAFRGEPQLRLGSKKTPHVIQDAEFPTTNNIKTTHLEKKKT